MHNCIEAIREKARTMLNSCSPSNLMQLDVAMMLALPLIPHDLKKAHYPFKITDLIRSS